GLRDLLVRPALLVEHNEHTAMFPAQLLQSGVNLANQFDRIVAGAIRDCFVQVIGQFRPARSLRQPGPAAVDGDPPDPRPERPRRIPAPQAAEDAQEHLLRHVLGILAMTEKPNAQPEHLGLIALDERVDGLGIPPQRTANQERIVVRHARSGYPKGVRKVSALPWRPTREAWVTGGWRRRAAV